MLQQYLLMRSIVTIGNVLAIMVESVTGAICCFQDPLIDC